MRSRAVLDGRGLEPALAGPLEPRARAHRLPLPVTGPITRHGPRAKGVEEKVGNVSTQRKRTGLGRDLQRGPTGFKGTVGLDKTRGRQSLDLPPPRVPKTGFVQPPET